MDTSSSRLGGEDSSPKSPWSPSYSVVSQGSSREPVKADDAEHIPPVNTDLSDQPNYDHVVATIETPAPVQPPLEAIVQGDHDELENLCDQSMVVPSIDITGSQEFPDILSTHEIPAEQVESDVVTQTSTGDVTPKVRATYSIDISD